MDMQIPKAVRVFEALQILSLFIGLIHAAVLSDLSLWDAIVLISPILILTLLVSRKRKQWPRVVLAVLYVAGLGMAIMLPHMAFGEGSLLVTVSITLCQGVALAFIFMPPASLWLNTAPRD